MGGFIALITCISPLAISEKLMTKNLVHGDLVKVQYQESGNVVFSLEFLIDFDDGKKKYERIIDAQGISTITIGSDPSNTIVLNSAFVKGDAVCLYKDKNAFLLDIKHSNYGVYINGKKGQE